MRHTYRQGRLAGEIKRIISDMLLHGIKGFELSMMVGITDVEVTSDGSYATIYINIIGNLGSDFVSEQEKEEVLRAFSNVRGHLRKGVASQLRIKHTPELIFKIDTSEDYARHIDSLFDQLT
jgi:ribosome-binding factor A